jgi:hypothetical protein
MDISFFKRHYPQVGFANLWLFGIYRPFDFKNPKGYSLACLSEVVHVLEECRSLGVFKEDIAVALSYLDKAVTWNRVIFNHEKDPEAYPLSGVEWQELSTARSILTRGGVRRLSELTEKLHAINAKFGTCFSP